MEANRFEAKMRELEYFHDLRLLPEAWAVVRVDGRSFSRFTSDRYEKPFDPKFHQFMVKTAQALLEEMGGVYAYTESDEISVLFPKDWDFFDRSLEKIVSISASTATATFVKASSDYAQFDSRVWLGTSSNLVVDYFSWRQADATRCALNGWCYWMLREQGKTAIEATQILEGKSTGFKNELLFQNGINFNGLPCWQRRGTGLYRECYEKVGLNPLTQETAIATRQRIKVDEELLMKEPYREWLEQFIE